MLAGGKLWSELISVTLLCVGMFSDEMNLPHIRCILKFPKYFRTLCFISQTPAAFTGSIDSRVNLGRDYMTAQGGQVFSVQVLLRTRSS